MDQDLPLCIVDLKDMMEEEYFEEGKAVENTHACVGHDLGNSHTCFGANV